MVTFSKFVRALHNPVPLSTQANYSHLPEKWCGTKRVLGAHQGPALTGNRLWKGMSPYKNGKLGVVSGFDASSTYCASHSELSWSHDPLSPLS